MRMHAFLLVASYRNNIRPRFRELHKLQVELRKKISAAWSKHLTESLPRKVVSESERITEHLLNTINPHNAFSDILNKREEQIKNKIEACYRERTAHIYRKEAEKPYVIKAETETINFDEVSQSLIEKAKLETTNFLEGYKELKKQNDEEVKQKLLPLLQRYISNPV